MQKSQNKPNFSHNPDVISGPSHHDFGKYSCIHKPKNLCIIIMYLYLIYIYVCLNSPSKMHFSFSDLSFSPLSSEIALWCGNNHRICYRVSKIPQFIWIAYIGLLRNTGHQGRTKDWCNGIFPPPHSTFHLEFLNVIHYVIHYD